tara:strand:- start:411 stop:1610 length:1200 start_codon:yes stop_codon:yes gene_type:complete
MSYFLLPINSYNITTHDLKLIQSNELNNININYISTTLKGYLLNNKSKIENSQQEWDNVKKYINPYEFIHTPIPYSKNAVAKYKPISRSYFKFIEISNMLQIVDFYNQHKCISSFHLAEGPGGFIEAIANLRKNTSDSYYGMTLISNDTNVPGWRKSQELFKKYPNIHLEKGSTKDGNILCVENYKYCCEKYKHSMDIITADGGFDFSIDFNMQEIMSVKLILAETLYAVTLQNYKGNFILKIFDCFSKVTSEILYFLSCFYEKVYIVKPHTSRYANSERYIVCKNFKLQQLDSSLILKFKEIISILSKEKEYIEGLLSFHLPYFFYTKLEEINSILGQQQIESIVNTLNLINHKNKNDKLEQLKNNNIIKCNNWCVKNKQPYYKTISQTNIFLTNSND